MSPLAFRLLTKLMIPPPFRVLGIALSLLAGAAWLPPLAQAQNLGSAQDGFDPNASDDSSAVLVRPDGKILVGGVFATVGGTPASGLALLHHDGSLDSTFSAHTNAGGDVRVITPQPDGKILVGGKFNTVAGVARNSIARLNANGTLDTSFNPNAPPGVFAIAVQPDGKILIGGDFTTVGGTARTHIARLNPDGTLDTSFNASANGFVLEMAVQRDGKILVGGFFTMMNGVGRNRLARLNADGSLDAAFDPDPNGTVRAFAVQSDGRIVLGGAYTMIGTTPRNRLCRVDEGGNLDPTFDPDVGDAIFQTLLQPDGKILIASQAIEVGGLTRNHIARLNTDGTVDATFDPNADDVVFGIDLQRDGRIVAVGRFTTMGGVTRNRIARLESDGRLDTTANPNADAALWATAVQPDGRAVIAGDFTTIGGVARNRIARLNTDGTLDPGFDPDADAGVRAAAIQADGKVIVGGIFENIGASARNRIARLDAGGNVEASFDPNADDDVYAVAVQPDGKILVAGGFSTIAGGSRTRLARLNEDGTLDGGFDPGVINSDVFTIAVQPDGDILIGGTFTSVGGTMRNRIARVHGNDGSLDTTFNPNSGGTVRTLILLADARVLVGGAFTTMGGTGRNRVALLNPNGTLDTGFNPNANSTVYALAAQTDGRILIGGAFTSIGATPRHRVARLHANGALDASFNPNANEAVYSLTLQTDGKVVVGGNFTTMGGTGRNYLARLTNSAAFQDVFVDATGTAITWARQGTSPEVDRVLVETSTDEVAWTSLGSATRIGATGDWELTGLTLPFSQNLFIRAQGVQTQGGVNGGDGSIYESVRLAYLAPEIVVEQPANTILADGGSEIDFGSQPRGLITEKTFTLRNLGSVNLNISSVSIDGTDSTEFTVSQAPATLIAPGDSTTLTVRFSPASIGPKSAALHIESDDADEGIFDVGLAGTGIESTGTLAIDLPPGSTINVQEDVAGGEVFIPIIRTGGLNGIVGITMSTVNGTAVAPADFTALTNAVVVLAHNESTGSQGIVIVSPDAAELNETFTVTISGLAVTPGGTTSVTVRIIDTVDTTLPSAPVITKPAANALVSVNTSGTLSIEGTAKDNRGVGSVQVKLNSGSFVDAVLTATGSTTTNWSLAVVPVTGTNTVTVQSADTRGNLSASVSRTFKVLRPLTVLLSDSTHGSVTSGFAGSTFREVGKSYTITATTKPPVTATGFPGTIFTGWTLGGVDVANGFATFTNNEAARIGVASTSLAKNTLTFIFREGMVLTANFSLNPFAPIAGTYHGLIRPSDVLPDRAPGGAGDEDGTASNNSTEGFFKATVQSTGAFSATLTIDGFTLNMAGVFDQNGDARFGTSRAPTLTVARPSKPSLVVALQIELNTPGVDDKIIGTVLAKGFQQSVTEAVSTVDSDRAFYNGTTRIVPPAYLGTNNANGIFTAVLPSKDVGDQPPAFTTQDYPQGDGIANVTLTKAGLVTIVGTLADGTPVTASSALSEIGAGHANRFPLFAVLYGKKGFLSGFVEMDNSQPGSDMSAVSLHWLRPFILTHYYPYGWPEVIKVDMLGARYLVASGQSSLKAPDGADGDDDSEPLQAPDDDGNAALTFYEGQLTENLIKAVNVSGTDVVTRVPDNDPTFTLSITRSSGMFTGTVTHTDDTKPTYKGIILQKGANAGGYGYFLTKQPAPINYTGESGGVSLIGFP